MAFHWSATPSPVEEKEMPILQDWPSFDISVGLLVHYITPLIADLAAISETGGGSASIKASWKQARQQMSDTFSLQQADILSRMRQADLHAVPSALGPKVCLVQTVACGLLMPHAQTFEKLMLQITAGRKAEMYERVPRHGRSNNSSKNAAGVEEPRTKAKVLIKPDSLTLLKTTVAHLNESSRIFPMTVELATLLTNVWRQSEWMEPVVMPRDNIPSTFRRGGQALLSSKAMPNVFVDTARYSWTNRNRDGCIRTLYLDRQVSNGLIKAVLAASDSDGDVQRRNWLLFIWKHKTMGDRSCYRSCYPRDRPEGDNSEAQGTAESVAQPEDDNSEAQILNKLVHDPMKAMRVKMHTQQEATARAELAAGGDFEGTPEEKELVIQARVVMIQATADEERRLWLDQTRRTYPTCGAQAGYGNGHQDRGRAQVVVPEDPTQYDLERIAQAADIDALVLAVVLYGQVASTIRAHMKHDITAIVEMVQPPASVLERKDREQENESLPNKKNKQEEEQIVLYTPAHMQAYSLFNGLVACETDVAQWVAWMALLGATVRLLKIQNDKFGAALRMEMQRYFRLGQTKSDRKRVIIKAKTVVAVVLSDQETKQASIKQKAVKLANIITERRLASLQQRIAQMVGQRLPKHRLMSPLWVQQIFDSDVVDCFVDVVAVQLSVLRESQRMASMEFPRGAHPTSTLTYICRKIAGLYHQKAVSMTR
jgi:hypothetical protein